MKHSEKIQTCKMLFLILALVGLMPPLGAQARKAQGNAPKIHLYEYLPTQECQTAVVVCPGGSYCWLSKKYEGSEVARWLNSQGIAAYVLHYPTAGWAGYAWHSRAVFGGPRYPDELNHLREAVREVRAKGYRHVGAMGFSAGGHLVLNAAEEGFPLDFIVPMYPVVTMNEPYVHHRSRRGLMGEFRWKNATLRDSLSMELHADRIECPVFMVNCKDDPIVDYHNALLMDSALTVHGKPHYYKLYERGGHGFGATAEKTSPEAIGWKQDFISWLKTMLNL